MNAKFGIILKSAKREDLLVRIPSGSRSWGDEIFEVGDVEFSFPKMGGVKFKIYPVLGFIKKHLPFDLQGDESEYASIDGEGLDDYENGLRVGRFDVEISHPFERGLKTLIDEIGLCSIMLVPDSDELEEFISINSSQLIYLVRNNIGNLAQSKGFLASLRSD
ncbi:hypothetical protein [Dyella tabacisoli]|uniref:Uncharacterized protein n=1 Tax=Dyella tabacisoli TaxID=2282381 RepID=A0A369UGU2_9GAMM|nr:hypothetical protein [Dyella tabacisoli]RDD79781.1 hypothetical protein DVJ77_20610 [Dyella tabacisoli]